MKCQDCFYFEKFDKSKGFCHRNPPDSGIVRTSFEWWCGEFRHRTEVIPVGVMNKSD
jgi:hypothetical protein